MLKTIDISTDGMQSYEVFGHYTRLAVNDTPQHPDVPLVSCTAHQGEMIHSVCVKPTLNESTTPANLKQTIYKALDHFRASDTSKLF